MVVRALFTKICGRRFFFFRHLLAGSLHPDGKCNPSRVAFASPAPRCNAPLAGERGLLTKGTAQGGTAVVL